MNEPYAYQDVKNGRYFFVGFSLYETFDFAVLYLHSILAFDWKPHKIHLFNDRTKRELAWGIHFANYFCFCLASNVTSLSCSSCQFVLRQRRCHFFSSFFQFIKWFFSSTGHSLNSMMENTCIPSRPISFQFIFFKGIGKEQEI